MGTSRAPTLTDESLLAGMGSGDSEAASDFVRRFRARVYGPTLSILRDPGAAEEAAQETFVRAWRYASAYDPRRGAVAPWLLTIARNVSLDMLPSHRIDPIDPEVLVALAGREQGEEQVDDKVLESEVLSEALTRLPASQRRVLLLAVLHGFTAREMSEMDGLPLGTVKTRIRSAMMKLRSEIAVSDDL